MYVHIYLCIHSVTSSYVCVYIFHLSLYYTFMCVCIIWMWRNNRSSVFAGLSSMQEARGLIPNQDKWKFLFHQCPLVNSAGNGDVHSVLDARWTSWKILAFPPFYAMAEKIKSVKLIINIRHLLMRSSRIFLPSLKHFPCRPTYGPKKTL